MNFETIPEEIPLRVDTDGNVRIQKSRVTLQTIVTAFNMDNSAEEINNQYPSLELADIYLVIGYYLRHRDAVDEYISASELELDNLRGQLHRQFGEPPTRQVLLAQRELS